MTATLPTQSPPLEQPLEPTTVETPVREPVTDSPSPEPVTGHTRPPRPRSKRPPRPGWLRALITPPDLWDQPRPSLQQIWMYARHGEWTGHGTVGRFLGVAYCVLVSFPAHVLLGLAGFIIERPARGGCVLLLLIVFSLTAPGHVVANVAADALTLLADLIRPEGG